MIAKFKEYFTKKVKLKIIVFSIISGCLLLLSILMMVPGVGLESKSFIDSIETQIKKIMPKGTYIIKGDSATYNTMMENVVRGAYQTDATSTLNSNEMSPEDYDAALKAYSEFANTWYLNRWENAIKEQKDLDLYDLGMDLVKFDKAVSTEFLSYGYVHAGIAWFFHPGGIKDIFSKERYNDALRNQTMIDQEVYDEALNYVVPGTNVPNINKSLGTLLLNNKTWFLNYQIENIKYGFNVMGVNVFEDSNLSVSTMPKSSMDISELYMPNFTSTLQVLRAGIVMFFIYIGLILPLYIYAMVMLIKNRKEKG
ncbi:hypothetical protein SCHIN_v1c05560 [Spiroplasma chinense]|uniref:Uncharacterized protein n=1 Tax=Spiroplasma chinense TaxID=216932 RepID=A0A5B9Y4Q2_9MOLU|nr:hypothetical protein [Spiroplasma chinense]QEH61753.1 hypothetical protein SCHIN_v1c05560 [Spiroplasma chinense]